MTNPEYVLIWVAIVSYALSSAAIIGGVVWGVRRLTAAAVWLAVVGVVGHGLNLGLRWARVGHGPSIGFFEVASGLAFAGVAGYLVLSWRYRSLRGAGVGLMPITLLIMGATLLVNPEAEQVSGSLVSFWLAIHVLFANLAYGCYAAGFVLAVGYLLREAKGSERWRSVLGKLPSQAELDGITFRIVGAGFVFQGVMIASGAIWANEAWGRYWGWDAMETWSLIAWVVYALYLHLTLTLGWKGKRAAWVLVIALGVILFSLLGVPVVYDSIHGAYLRV